MTETEAALHGLLAGTLRENGCTAPQAEQSLARSQTLQWSPRCRPLEVALGLYDCAALPTSRHPFSPSRSARPRGMDAAGFERGAGGGGVDLFPSSLSFAIPSIHPPTHPSSISIHQVHPSTPAQQARLIIPWEGGGVPAKKMMGTAADPSHGKARDLPRAVLVLMAMPSNE